MAIAMAPVGTALAFGTGFPGYGASHFDFGLLSVSRDHACASDINVDARKRATERNKKELEEQRQKGGLSDLVFARS